MHRDPKAARMLTQKFVQKSISELVRWNQNSKRCNIFKVNQVINIIATLHCSLDLCEWVPSVIKIIVLISKFLYFFLSNKFSQCFIVYYIASQSYFCLKILKLRTFSKYWRILWRTSTTENKSWKPMFG